MKKKNIIIIIAIIVILFIMLIFLNTKNYDKEIASYIEKKGYKLDDTGTYVKDITSTNISYFYNNENVVGTTYKGLSFNIATYELTKNDFKNSNGAILYFIGNYDYKTDKINYTYRIVYKNSNAIYQGNYIRRSKKFTCENIFSYNTTIKENGEIVCSNANSLVKEFLSDINSFITEGTYIKFMQKQKAK